MKYTGLLALALLITPTLASAQTPPPDAAGGPPPAMLQMHEQVMQARMQARSQMLGALSAQHRTLLANVVGSLAIAPSPNVLTAAQQLDAALSPQEKQAIVTAESSFRSQMRSAMQNMPNDGHAPPPGPPATARTPDAGMALIHAALGFGGPMRSHAP